MPAPRRTACAACCRYRQPVTIRPVFAARSSTSSHDKDGSARIGGQEYPPASSRKSSRPHFQPELVLDHREDQGSVLPDGMPQQGVQSPDTSVHERPVKAPRTASTASPRSTISAGFSVRCSGRLNLLHAWSCEVRRARWACVVRQFRAYGFQRALARAWFRTASGGRIDSAPGGRVRQAAGS